MAGIYLHIPFCRKACAYCDFHFSTLSRDREAMPAALLQEAELRKDYLGGPDLQTVYFGGGTPSVLEPSSIQEILEGLKRNFSWPAGAEITIEANPDDLNEAYLKALADTEVNRLSIGIQSFKDSDLQFMNRAHTAAEARKALDLAKKFGFDISIDLIYGLPGQSAADWQWQLEQMDAYQVPHFSAYALTVEEKTVLAKWVKQGKVHVDEAAASVHFKLLQDFANQRGYQHYELSNFAKKGAEAKHNSSYWEGAKYLGLGPAAHSYDGAGRHWNIANNALYLKAIANGELLLESEELSAKDRYNEWLMVGLRRVKGIDSNELDRLHPQFSAYFKQELVKLINDGSLQQEGSRIFIPAEARFFSDGIASELFYTE